MLFKPLIFLGVFFSLLIQPEFSFAKDRSTAEGICFTENKGQLHDQNRNTRPDILYYGSTASMGYYLRHEGVSYQLYAGGGSFNDRVTIQRVDIEWVNANMNAPLHAIKALPGYSNYYNTSTPVLDVKSYEGVTYKNIYPGIDLQYYRQHGKLKYDFIIHPGADHKQIKLLIKGASLLEHEDGSVAINTSIGSIVEGKPVAYQGKKEISATWQVKNSMLSFEIANYDRSKVLVIDPLVYQWTDTKQYANAYSNSGRFCMADNNGNVSWCGNVWSTSFSTFGSQTNAFMSKNSSNGATVALTYFPDLAGFAGNVVGSTRCASDASANMYMTGVTTLTSNIATTGAYQTTLSGSTDAFLVKMDSTGTKLWATYYGGTADDWLDGCITDANGNIYATGCTYSTGLATVGSHQPAHAGGGNDAIIAKFNSTGQLIWATYYGGNANDVAFGCHADKLGHIYICGNASSAAGIATPGAFQSSLSGTTNAFLLKMDTNGVRQWATYFGLTSTGSSQCVADSMGNVYMCGSTTDAGLATTGVFQTSIGGSGDGYITKFDNIGARVWTSYIGGSGVDAAMGCTVNKWGKLFICGNTTSTNNIATPGSFQESASSNFPNNNKAFLVEFDTAGQRKWGTYYYPTPGLTASNYNAWGWACSADDSGNVFLCGTRSGGTMINYTPYIMKFSPYTTPAPIISATAATFCQGNTVQLSIAPFPGATYQWYLNGIAIGGATATTYNAIAGGSYTAAITHNSYTATSAPVVLTSFPIPSTTVSKTDVSCNGAADGNISITATGGAPPYSYSWNSLSSTSAFVTSLTEGTYISLTTDANGCTAKDTTVISQPSPITINNVIADVPCSGAPIGSIILTVSGGTPPYTYSWNSMPSTAASLTGLSTGNYIATVTDQNGCIETDTGVVAQSNEPLPSSPLVSICAVTLDSATNRNLIVWEKTGDLHAAYYNIYRETSVSNQYALIGSQPSGQFSTFLDTSADPLQQSYKYKITETDSCSNEFAMSDHHLSIHLQANLGVNGAVNLSWNLYEGQPYSTHYVMLSNNGGPFINIAQVSGTTTTYTDLAPLPGQKDYRIDINVATSCNPTAKTSSYSYISSNIVRVDPAIVFHPNPTIGMLHIKGTTPASIQVEDATGKLVIREAKGNSVSLQSLANGVYIIKLLDDKGNRYYQEKVIKR